MLATSPEKNIHFLIRSFSWYSPLMFSILTSKGAIIMTNKKEIEQKVEALDGWEIEGSKKIYKNYKFKNFQQALDFTNQVGAVAEEMQHHPDIYLTWGKVEIEIFTHEEDSLTDADFELAERIDQID